MPEYPELPATPAPPWLQVIESEIVDRLKITFPAVPVEALPDKDWNFVHPKGAVLVTLADIKPAPSRSLYVSTHELTLGYEVFLMARSLRDHTGLYPMMFTAFNALLSWKPTGCQPLRLARTMNGGYDDGKWGWSLVFETNYTLVPCLDPATVYPPMKNIDFNNCGEDCNECP